MLAHGLLWNNVVEYKDGRVIARQDAGPIPCRSQKADAEECFHHDACVTLLAGGHEQTLKLRTVGRPQPASLSRDKPLQDRQNPGHSRHCCRCLSVLAIVKRNREDVFDGLVRAELVGPSKDVLILP